MAKIIFFGNEQLAQGLEKPITPTFDALLKSEHEIVALVLPRNPESKSRQYQSPEIVKKANENNVPVIFADKETDLNETLRIFMADIGALSSFGKIVEQSTINIFPHGIINLHPSLLPKYRGSTPIESVISNGDRTTGISLMKLTSKMDAGPIFTQEKVTLSGHETKQELYEKLAKLGANLIARNITNILHGNLKPKPQEDSAATYTKQLTKSDSVLNLNTMTADECERKVRAFLNYPRTKLDFFGKQIIITKAHVEDDSALGGMLCADSKYLVIDELISPTSGKQMKMSDYLRGLH